MLIVGAAGVLGAMVARSQLAAGHKVRVFGRSHPKLAGLAELGAEVSVGDLSDAQAVAGATCGVDQVFTSAHGFTAPGRNGSRRTDLEGNLNLLEAAQSSGTAHFVFTSVRMNEAMMAIDFMAHKRAIELALRSSGLSFTVLRPTAFMDTWAWVVGSALLAGQPVPVYGDGTNPINFVAAADVAAVAEVALARAGNVLQETAIGGPENLSQLQVIELFERALGRKAVKRHMPAHLLRVMSLIWRPFRPAVSRQFMMGYCMASSPQTWRASAAEPPYPPPATRFAQWIDLHWLPAVLGRQDPQAPDQAVP